MAKHPGSTKAQRHALDLIGCGDNSPRMSEPTRKALLKAGKIVHLYDEEICRDRFGSVSVPVYEMSIPTHIEWCEYQASLSKE